MRVGIMPKNGGYMMLMLDMNELGENCLRYKDDI